MLQRKQIINTRSIMGVLTLLVLGGFMVWITKRQPPIALASRCMGGRTKQPKMDKHGIGL